MLQSYYVNTHCVFHTTHTKIAITIESFEQTFSTTGIILMWVVFRFDEKGKKNHLKYIIHSTLFLWNKQLYIASFYQRVITSTSNNSLYINIHLSDI